MFFQDPLGLSHLFLTSVGTQFESTHLDRIPRNEPILVVSNHRSFMDAPLLMAALGQSVRFACHHYMSQVPVLRETVQALGCLPLETSPKGQQTFFEQAGRLLKQQRTVGIFPEGGQCMVKPTSPSDVAPFQRGFAHLALRSQFLSFIFYPWRSFRKKKAFIQACRCRYYTFLTLPNRYLSEWDGIQSLSIIK
jgi:1-acyl-sn-glycerol-3-phosphate acyltransferase